VSANKSKEVGNEMHSAEVGNANDEGNAMSFAQKVTA